jgi:hypothetical protein
MRGTVVGLGSLNIIFYKPTKKHLLSVDTCTASGQNLNLLLHYPKIIMSLPFSTTFCFNYFKF